MHSRQAFTLIELLVVIAIIAILAVVVVLTLNPAQLLASGRDSSRISDMSSLNSAINLYNNTDQGGASGYSLGSSNTVYISIPDPNATTTAGSNCSSLNLPALPSTYSYHCAGPSYYKNINGTGWIPVNLSSMSTGAPLSNLPADPTNTSSSRLYYTYETNGSQFETTAAMESQKYQTGGSNDVISPDGGPLASVYEKGSQLGLEPLDYGDNSLVGFWPLTEGTGTIAYDDSGNNATGSWNGTKAGTNGTYYSPGKVGPWAGAFDGNTDAVSLPISSSLEPTMVTVTAWVNENSIWSSGYTNIGCLSHVCYDMLLDHGGNIGWNIQNGGSRYSLGYGPVNASTWYFLAGTFNGSSMHFYTNGQEVAGSPEAASLSYGSPNLTIGALNGGPLGSSFLIDDVRIYNRALSAAQVTAMYAGGK
jgi:prepilin-type N-terminal cleavage/methylation domain-containing protein